MIKFLTQSFIYISVLFFVSNLYLDIFDNGILNIPPYIFYIIFSVVGLFVLALNRSFTLPSILFPQFLFFYGIFTILVCLHFVFIDTFIGVQGHSERGIDFIMLHIPPLVVALIFSSVVINSKIKNIYTSILKLVFFVGLFTSVHCIVDVFYFESEYIKDIGRGDALFNNSNYAGKLITFSFALTVFRLPQYHWFAIPIYSVGILSTFSKSSFLLYFLVCLYFFYNIFYKKKNVINKSYVFLLGTLVLILFTGVLGFFLTDSPIGELIGPNSLNRITSYDISDASLLERVNVVIYSFENLLKHPLFGNGLMYTYYWPELEYSTHNIFLLYLVEMGATGLISILPIYYILFKVDSQEGKLFFILYLFASMFDHNQFQQLPVWFLYFICLLSDKHIRKNFNLS